MSNFIFRILLSLVAIHGISQEYVSGDYISSISGLKTLFTAEYSLIKNFEKFLKVKEREVAAFKEHLANYERANGTIDTTSPIATFKRINSIVSLMDTLMEDYEEDDFQFLMQTTSELPKRRDLEGATRGIMRIQDTYKLDAGDIARGLLMGKAYGSQLSAHDCFILGKTCLDLSEPKLAIDWLLQAKSIGENENLNQIKDGLLDIDNVDFQMQLVRAFMLRENFKMALQLLHEILKAEPDNTDANDLKEHAEESLYSKRHSLKYPSVEIETFIDNDPILIEQTARLCRGDVQASSRSFYCMYSANGVDFYRLAPFKVEIYSEDPYVAVFHNVISNNEIEFVKSKSQHLRISMINEGEVDSVVRNSCNDWFDMLKHAELQNLADRLMDITNLTFMAAELFQIAQYGIGGQYLPHGDHEDEINGTETEGSRRLLTALFYLSDVDLGGYTVFPWLSVRVPPIKGSLLVWRNLHNTGSQDYRMKHAGCPVVKGIKWIATQWFHDIGQEETCGFFPDDFKSQMEKDCHLNLVPMIVG